MATRKKTGFRISFDSPIKPDESTAEYKDGLLINPLSVIEFN